ncbi:MAG: hypothetical protein R2698_07715 [Microthrixaceae bacterium]
MSNRQFIGALWSVLVDHAAATTPNELLVALDLALHGADPSRVREHLSRLAVLQAIQEHPLIQTQVRTIPAELTTLRSALERLLAALEGGSNPGAERGAGRDGGRVRRTPRRSATAVDSPMPGGPRRSDRRTSLRAWCRIFVGVLRQVATS